MNKRHAKRQGAAIAEAIRTQTIQCGGEAHVLVGTVTGNPHLPLLVNLTLMGKMKKRLLKRYPSIIMVLVVKGGLVHAHMILWTEQDVRAGLSHPLLWALSEERDRTRGNSKKRQEIESQLKQEFRSNRALMAARLHFRKEKEALQLGWMWTLEPVLKNIDAVAFYTCGNYIQGAAWKANASENYRRTNIYLHSGIPKGVKPRWQDIVLNTPGSIRHRRALGLIDSFFQVENNDFAALDHITGWDKKTAHYFAYQICRRLGKEAETVLAAPPNTDWRGIQVLADLTMPGVEHDPYSHDSSDTLIDHTRDRDADWFEAHFVSVPPEECQGLHMQEEAAA